MPQPPHIVHFRPSFGAGGAEMRTAQIINHLGSRWRHTMVTFDGDFTFAGRIAEGISIRYETCRNTGNPLQMIPRIRKLLGVLRPDLILTYAWGGLDAVAANSLGRFAPLIHMEDGFDVDEVHRQLPRRVWYRRIFLRGANAVLVPSRTLADIAHGAWKIPAERLRLVPNGVDTARFSPGPRPAGPAGMVTVGCVANLKPVKRQRLLIEACAAAGVPVRLLLAGEGPDRPMLEAAAERLGLRERVAFLGLQSDTVPVYRQLDIFAMSSVTEQMPLTVLEAMAAGLPVVSTDVGDIQSMVCEANRPFIVDESRYPEALAALLRDEPLRARIGRENRERAIEVYDLGRMLDEHEALYRQVLSGGSAQRIA